jgi:hypothetical protein
VLIPKRSSGANLLETPVPAGKDTEEYFFSRWLLSRRAADLGRPLAWLLTLAYLNQDAPMLTDGRWVRLGFRGTARLVVTLARAQT